MLKNSELYQSEEIEKELNAIEYKSLICQTLIHPGRLNNSFLPHTFVAFIRSYVEDWDYMQKIVYSHYLKQISTKKTALILNIPEFQVVNLLNCIMNHAYDYCMDSMEGNIDLKTTCTYEKCLKDKNMQDEQIAATFHEEVTTTKVVRLFVDIANVSFI